jgi:hypothetical protein
VARGGADGGGGAGTRLSRALSGCLNHGAAYLEYLEVKKQMHTMLVLPYVKAVCPPHKQCSAAAPPSPRLCYNHRARALAILLGQADDLVEPWTIKLYQALRRRPREKIFRWRSSTQDVLRYAASEWR